MKLILAFFLVSIAYATEIPTTRNLTPMLGQGYLSERQSLAGECLKGEIVSEGSPEASISYASSISEQQLASELGLAAGAKARLGVIQAVPQRAFLTRLVQMRFRYRRFILALIFSRIEFSKTHN